MTGRGGLVIGLVILALLSSGVGLLLAAESNEVTGQKAGQNGREELYQKNNLGVALMEQYKHEEAAAKFREALAGDGSFTIGRINLALALYFMNDGKSAATEAAAALKLAPESPQALYVLGAAYKKDRLYQRRWPASSDS